MAVGSVSRGEDGTVESGREGAYVKLYIGRVHPGPAAVKACWDMQTNGGTSREDAEI